MYPLILFIKQMLFFAYNEVSKFLIQIYNFLSF